MWLLVLYVSALTLWINELLRPPVTLQPTDKLMVEQRMPRPWQADIVNMAFAFSLFFSIGAFGCAVAEAWITQPKLSPWKGVLWFAMLLGYALRWWAQRTLGRLFTYQLAIREEHRLVCAGPYTSLRIRHPSYTGLLLSWLFFLLLLGLTPPLATLAFVILATPLMMVRIPAEERMLAAAFPKDWPIYVALVPHHLITFVW